MLKFARLIVRNVGRNRLRTTLTATAVVALVVIHSFASTVTDRVRQLVDAHSSQTRLAVQGRWVMPTYFPSRYVSEIAQIDGVEDWSVWHFYGATLDEAGTQVVGVATRVDNLREMHPELADLDPALHQALKREKTGILVGQQMMANMDWKVGRKLTMNSFTHVGRNLEFTIVGELSTPNWQNTFLFREDYYQEATGDKDVVNVMWLKVHDVETGQRVAAEVEARYENSRAELKVETEAAGIARITEHVQTLMNVLNLATTVLLLNMAIVMCNSISMTVRERRKETAILKVLGFSPRQVVAMIVGEAVFVGALSGLLGGGLAYLVSALNTAGNLPVKISYLMMFPVTPTSILQGLLIGGLAAFAGSVIPAWNTRKVRVADVFAKVV